jgi:transposase
VQRFLSTRPVKTDKNDARGIAELMGIGHYRPEHVKSAEAQPIRTTLPSAPADRGNASTQ